MSLGNAWPPGSKSQAVSAQWHALSKGIFQASLLVGPGYYDVDVYGDQCDINRPLVLVVLPDHDRNIVVFLSRVRALAEVGLTPLAVVLPNASLSVSLEHEYNLGTKGVPPLRPRVDGEVAYFDELLPGKYMMIVAGFGGVSCLPLVIGETNGQVVVERLSLDELTRRPEYGFDACGSM